MRAITIKLIALVVIIIIISLGASYFIPVRKVTYNLVELYIDIDPSNLGDYKVYFPLYLEGSYQQILNHIDIVGNGTLGIIKTVFGMTLIIDANGPMNVNFDRRSLENFNIIDLEGGLYENSYPIFLNKSLEIESISMKFYYSVYEYGYAYNIFGQLGHWDGRHILREGEATLYENGWQGVPTN